jgi:hypothetical protein
VKRRSTTELAVRSAFARSSKGRPDASPTASITTRIRQWWLTGVAGFPAVVGGLMVFFALERGVPDSSAVVVGTVLLLGAFALLVLGLRSFLTLDGNQLTVRFYGIRSTTVRLDELDSATFAMLFPSISYVITLADRNGRKARIHANWWRDESTFMPPICRSLVEHDVALDRMTARIVSRVLKIKRPKARVVHHALLRKDRTW